jgi:hypothetical protein
MFESIMEEQFGDSEYKQWVRHLYELGLISGIPSEWEAAETPEEKSEA